MCLFKLLYGKFEKKLLETLIPLEESWDHFSKGLSPCLMSDRLGKCFTWSFHHRLGYCEF
jgi:hypothetical protein